LVYIVVFVLAFFSPNRKSDGWANWRLALLWSWYGFYKDDVNNINKEQLHSKIQQLLACSPIPKGTFQEFTENQT